MSDEQINIAIAEACGYEWVSNGWGCRFLGSPTERSCGSDTQSPLCEDAYSSVPNYCNDLNAMHEAENVLPRQLYHVDYWQKGYGRFQTLLAELTITPYSATAAQRAEAFLKTLGKWEGGK